MLLNTSAATPQPIFVSYCTINEKRKDANLQSKHNVICAQLHVSAVYIHCQAEQGTVNKTIYSAMQ